MYPKNVLQRYGEALEDPTEREIFLSIIGKLTGDIRGGIEQIMSGAISLALEDTAVEHLEEDLAKRWLEFFDPDEDSEQEVA